jgi:hypothetical protein
MLLFYADETFGSGNVGTKIEKGTRRLFLFFVSRCGVECPQWKTKENCASYIKSSVDFDIYCRPDGIFRIGI